MSDNPEKIAELQNDKLVEILHFKNLGVPVCRHNESKGHNGQQFVKPEYVIETFPSVEFLKSINLLKMQIRSLVSVRKELHVETSTVPYLEISNASAAASSSPSTTTLTAEEVEKLLQEAAPLFSSGKYSEAVDVYSRVIDNISTTESVDASLKTILSRALSNRSGSFLKLKKAKEALDDARRCVDVRPSWVRAHLRVAAAAQELIEVDIAIAAYEAAVKAEDRSGNVPSQEQLEADIISLKRRQWWNLIILTKRPGVSATGARDALISAAQYCTDAESAELFCRSIGKLTVIESNRILFGTAAVRDALLTVSKYCTIPDAGYTFCFSISNFAVNENNRIVFGTASIRDALVAVSKHCASADAAGLFCQSISNLAVNDNNEVLFGTASVRDALVAVSKFCVTPSSADSFCRAIAVLTANNDANKVLFTTASVRDAILAVSKYCTSTESANWFCSSIAFLTNNENYQILFGTVYVRDALLTVSKYCTTPDSAHSFCVSISNLTVNENNRVLFGTAAVRDALLTASKYCTSDDSAKYLCSAIENIIDQNQSNGVLFATEAIRDAMLSASAYVDDYFGVFCCCRAISLFHETNPTLFRVKQTVKSLVKLSKVEIHSLESIYSFLEVILALLHSDKKLFDTPEIRAAVERFQKVVDDPEKVKKLEKKPAAVDALSSEEYVVKACQLCVEFQKIVSGKSEASSSSAADAAAACTSE